MLSGFEVIAFSREHARVPGVNGFAIYKYPSANFRPIVNFYHIPLIHAHTAVAGAATQAAIICTGSSMDIDRTVDGAVIYAIFDPMQLHAAS